VCEDSALCSGVASRLAAAAGSPIGDEIHPCKRLQLRSLANATDGVSRPRQARKSRWVVMLGNSLYAGNSLYGTYLDKEQAVLDAVDAARDVLQAGHQAQVWIKDRSTAARVF